MKQTKAEPDLKMDEDEDWKTKCNNLQATIDNYKKTYSLDRCWLCGTPDNITRHHLQIRRHRKAGLGTIPLCRPCHTEVEELRKGYKTFFKKYYSDEFQKQVKGLKRRENYWKKKYEELKAQK
jgi:ribosomal protein S14